MKRWVLCVAVGMAASAVGCKDSGGGDDDACRGAKCDNPFGDTDGGGTAGDGADTGGTVGDETDGGESSGGETTGGELDPVSETCLERRTDAFNPNRLAFTDGALRWSCNDVPGTALVDRGQEYCEYFSIVDVPGGAGPAILGMNLGPDSTYGTTDLALPLTGSEMATLESMPDAVVGTCVFTSWNADVPDPTACPFCAPPPSEFGVPMDESVFRMKFDPNTLEAAQVLVDECMGFLPPMGDPANPDDLLHDDFFRGCQLNHALNETEHRKSDNIICSSTLRLAECGCGLPPPVTFAEALSPDTRRGFPLGSWVGMGDLPPGCRYAPLSDGTENIVLCDLTALEVLGNASALKQYCRETYADNVVVHIPVDGTAVTCLPNDEEYYGMTCSQTPWVLEQ